MQDEKGPVARALQKLREQAEHYEASHKKRANRRFFLSRFFARKINIDSLPIEEGAAKNKKDYENKLDNDDMVRWTATVAKYTKWLVVVGGVGTFVALCTLWVIKGQLDEMQTEQRPWIGRPKVTYHSHEGSVYHFIIVMKDRSIISFEFR